MSISTRRHSRSSYGADNVVATPVDITFNASLLAIQTASYSDEIVNSGRGQYEWLTVPYDPGDWPASGDIYRRNPTGNGAISWLSLETSTSASNKTYNMQNLETYLALAASQGGRLGFRIMAYMDGEGQIVPSYIPMQTSECPDWNSETFLKAWEDLMVQLNAYAGNDPRLQYIDVGGYGDWGEWGIVPSTPITKANGVRMINAVASAFPNKWVLMNFYERTESDGSTTSWPTLATTNCNANGNVGLRFDDIGMSAGQVLDYMTNPVRYSWETVPTVGEWMPATNSTYMDNAIANIQNLHISLLSSGNRPFTYAAATSTQKVQIVQSYKMLGFRYGVTRIVMKTNVSRGQAIPVTTTWQNDGVAPTYDTWIVNIVLKGQDGVEHLVPLNDNLKTLLGSSATQSTTTQVTIPSALAKGTTHVGISVHDSQSYLAPMRLTNSGLTASGAHYLGDITIA